MSATYLQQQISSAPADVQKEYMTLKEYHDSKLWHQTTLHLEKFILSPYFAQNPKESLELYNNFVKVIGPRMNQLQLVRIVLQLLKYVPDANVRLNTLLDLKKSLNAAISKEAYCYTVTSMAFVKLTMLKMPQDALKDCEDAKKILDSVASVTPEVNASYYEVLSKYYKEAVSPTDFYKNSLMYLVYVELEQIPATTQQSIAFDLGIAALVSPDIHNFGELLSHPIINVLQGTDGQWIHELLLCINAGDVAKYEQFLNANQAKIQSQSVLHANLPLLRQKVSVLALMELVFRRPAENRTVTFDEVSVAVKLQPQEVEFLLMKAMSINLVKGSIDEVDRTITITWMQPRVLQLAQVETIKEKLKDWKARVQETLVLMENELADDSTLVA